MSVVRTWRVFAWLLPLFEYFHYLVQILLRTPDAVPWAAVPRAYGFFHIVFGVVVSLNQDEHLFRFPDVETVRQFEALFAFLLLKNVVAFFHQYRSDLHRSARVSAYGFRIAFAFYFNYRIHHRIPIEFRAIRSLVACAGVSACGKK